MTPDLRPVRCRLLLPVTLASTVAGPEVRVSGRPGDVLTLRRCDAALLLTVEPGCLVLLPELLN